MPTYSYACTACDHRFDVQQAFSDAALSDCPECTGRLRKLFGSVGVVFKGSGFYRTDSRAGSGATGRSGGSKEKAGASSSSGSGSGSGSSGSSGSAGSSGSTGSSGAAGSSGSSGTSASASAASS